MISPTQLKRLLTAGFLCIASQTIAATATIRVQLDVIGPVGIAPVAGVFHDGSFDGFNAGSAASPALETLAEMGNPTAFLANVPASANAGRGASPTTPGLSSFYMVTADTTNSRFSYAAMLVPSNDWFIGNDNSLDVSALLGTPGTSVVITVFNVWNAGTELEDFAFSAGNPILGVPAGNTALGTAENGVVGLVASTNPYGAFANQPVGFDPASGNFSGLAVARITLTNVPEPTSSVLMLPCLMGLLRRKRA